MEKFAKHGAEFGVATPDEYLQLADTFLGGPLNPGTTWECVRENGDHLRYNTETEEFGVLRPDGVIKTYFKPDPADHRQSNNVEYFRKACRQ
ncbi:MAG: hypothetical protein HY216_03710 [Candidatus Rokubacteria bacterium]|nr:hypothetical protein [Candidatus Rokubacteria bacterium]